MTWHKHFSCLHLAVHRRAEGRSCVTSQRRQHGELTAYKLCTRSEKGEDRCLFLPLTLLKFSRERGRGERIERDRAEKRHSKSECVI